MWDGLEWGERNANVYLRHKMTVLCGAERDQRKGAAHQEGLNTWARLSSVDKLNEARRSKGSLQHKKGWRMKPGLGLITMNELEL
jgi:hypothetical protein